MRIIPEKLLDKGISLSAWGINEVAWKKKDALELVEYLLENDCNIGVSGGDVYFLNDSKLIPSYDNWFCNPNLNENNYDYNKRSLLKTKNYIISYKVLHENTFFSFVFSDYVVFEDEDE